MKYDNLYKWAVIGGVCSELLVCSTTCYLVTTTGDYAWGWLLLLLFCCGPATSAELAKDKLYGGGIQ